MSAYRQAQADRLDELTSQLNYRNALTTIPDTDEYRSLGLAGQQMSNEAFQGLTKVMAQNQGRYDTKLIDKDIAQLKYGDGSTPGPLNTTFKDVNGQTLLVRKGTGETLKVLGPSNSIATAYARARAQAQYGIVPTVTDTGEPTNVSRLTAVTAGTPVVPFGESRGVTSDKVGIQQYEDILNHQISPNLAALNDNTQRAVIAHTLAEADRNPGAIQSVLTAAAQQGLSPQGAALVAGILQGREFGGVARKYGGNMNGTEGLMNRIMSNQASPLNSEALNRDLIQNDLAFTQKAKTALGGLTKRGVPTGNAPRGTSQQPTGNDPFAKFGGRSR
jgi:hypothetical protein